ncbi:MAG: gliding motility-associated C-terminal domain-containing protein [Cyclobacteriaceae bacterium]
MRYIKNIFFFILLIFSFHSRATHIRAGEVVAKKISTLTYEFTFFGYRDQDGVVFGNGRFDFGDGTFAGEGTDRGIPWDLNKIVVLGNGVERWEFTLSHTYQAPNNYLVSYTENNRNDNILNIPSLTPFYVETLVVIDALIPNSTPFFTVPPIDQGVVGFRFEHNPGAFDPDGDSLSYFFTTPKMSRVSETPAYRTLNDPSFYDNFSTGIQAGDGPPTLSIDPANGTLVWDSPGGILIPPLENREYNVAFVVEEWRKINGEWFKLGFVTRDMQIIIWNFDNEPPKIEVPDDTCLVAGTHITQPITATDPDGDPVKLEVFGGPFEVNPPFATFTPSPPVFQESPALLVFDWTAACGQVRERPYEVQIKATDDPTIPMIGNAPGSANFETWRITVIGPQPTGLTANAVAGRSIQLNWEDYSCTNADFMEVYRRVGEFAIDAACNPGVPENAGFELVEVLDIGVTNYLDNNKGIGLAAGSRYCYRLVATFPGPAGGLSLASEEACDSLTINVPLITNVDIKSTNETTGQIDLRWTPPYQIDVAQFPPNYSYTVLRTEGQGPDGTFVPIAMNQADTFLLDEGLNTKNLTFAYKIVLHDNAGIAIDTSAVASSIRLEPTPEVGTIKLNWTGNTPWSLSTQEFPYHFIYRDNVDNANLSALRLIDSVEVTMNGLTYLDDGRFNGVNLDEEIEYCYWVSTQGSYGNALIPAPLINNSQIICAQPNDTIPPCTPVAIAFDTSAPFSCDINSNDQSCDFNDYQNRLFWERDGELACGDDINRFRVYFSQTGEEGSFLLLSETQGLFFVHDGLSSYAGCYMITSVDRSGNESQFSEVFCNDNCPQFLLPNVFTPNGDGVNDLFRPFYSGNRIEKEITGFSNTSCPRFVRSLDFKVFNRAGTSVFEFNSAENEGDFLINWDGTTAGGRELPAGAYFYSAEVTFARLNPEDALEVYSGWVQILR